MFYLNAWRIEYTQNIYTIKYIYKKNITSYTFKLVFKIVESLQGILKHI